KMNMCMAWYPQLSFVPLFSHRRRDVKTLVLLRHSTWRPVARNTHIVHLAGQTDSRFHKSDKATQELARNKSDTENHLKLNRVPLLAISDMKDMFAVRLTETSKSAPFEGADSERLFPRACLDTVFRSPKF